MKYSRHDGYARLAAAIIAKGKQDNDKAFLDANWCEMLREMCALDDAKEHGGLNNIDLRNAIGNVGR